MYVKKLKDHQIADIGIFRHGLCIELFIEKMRKKHENK